MAGYNQEGKFVYQIGLTYFDIEHKPQIFTYYNNVLVYYYEGKLYILSNEKYSFECEEPLSLLCTGTKVLMRYPDHVIIMRTDTHNIRLKKIDIVSTRNFFADNKLILYDGLNLYTLGTEIITNMPNIIKANYSHSLYNIVTFDGKCMTHHIFTTEGKVSNSYDVEKVSPNIYLVRPNNGLIVEHNDVFYLSPVHDKSIIELDRNGLVVFQELNGQLKIHRPETALTNTPPLIIKSARNV